MRSVGDSDTSGQGAGTPVLCDAHVHLWAEHPPLDAYIVAHGFPANVSSLVALMDEHGVDQTAVVTPRAMGWDNSVTLAAARAHPQRIVAIGLVNPQAARPEEYLRNLTRSGFAGVRLSPFNEPGQTWLAGDGFRPFWATADEEAFPVHLHIAASQLPQVFAIAERFRNVPIVIDHLGRPDVEAGTVAAPFQTFLALARYPNMMAKTPSSGFFSHTGAPFLDLVPFMQVALEAYGTSRILWGSDWPGCLAHGSYSDTREPWFSHMPNLDPQSRVHLFGRNFMRLYRRTTSMTETSP